MRLFELAYACKIYEALTSFDDAYFELIEGISGRLVFADDAHMKTLVRWLNKWGCRQFALSYHPLAISNIRTWASQYESLLPKPGTLLTELTDRDIDRTAAAFSELQTQVASERQMATGKIRVSIGPTGAAKILFAARPHSLPPWDDPIRRPYRNSYSAYLRDARDGLVEVAQEAQMHGISSEAIPEAIGRDGSTFAKLIDEYNWVTITRRVETISAEQVGKWYEWSR